MKRHLLLSRGIIDQPFIFNKMKTYIQPHHKVAIILYSFFDKHISNIEAYDAYYGPGGEYYLKMTSLFAAYDIPEKNLLFVHYFSDSIEEAIKKIEQADIIYFPGGAPELMMKRIIDKGIKEALEQHDGLYIGSSAGTMIQFENYHMSPDGDYPYFSYEKGLHLLSGFFVEVHYRRRKKQKAALRKVNRAYHQDIYAIPDDGALFVGEHIECLGSAFKIYHQKGINRGAK